MNDETKYTFRATLAYVAADIFERCYPSDDRVRKCAEAWEALAHGENVDIDEARDGARDAAMRAKYPAAKAAAWSVVWDSRRPDGKDAVIDASSAEAWDASECDKSGAWNVAQDNLSKDISRWMSDIIDVYEVKSAGRMIDGREWLQFPEV